MKAHLKVMAGLLLALAIAAPTVALATDEDVKPNKPHTTEPAGPKATPPDTPCIRCFNAARQGLLTCMSNATTKEQKANCTTNMNNVIASCNTGVCAARK
jgi:hypothetical protein